MIKVLLQLELVYPYNASISHLFEFNMLWGGCLISGSTNESKALIYMDAGKFKKLFGENPKKGSYKVPKGAEYFIKAVEVKEILVVEDSK